MATRSRTPRLPGFGRKGPESERLVTAEKTSIKSRSKVCLRRGEGLRDCKLPAKGLLESAISSASYDDALIGALYARGFLLVKHRIDPPVQTWQESQFGDWWLYRDPRVGVERSLGESSTVLLLGRAILLGAIGSHRTEIAQHLVHHYETSRQRFDECVELLCGNYVLMAAHGRDLSVQSDAAGLRSIFYSPEGKAVGSHASLVASRSRSRPTAFSDSSLADG